MQFPDLPDIWEEDTIIKPNPPEFTVRPQNNFNVSVKPSGEFNFQGNDPEVVRQIITTTDYNRAASRSQELEILKQSKNVDMITFGVLASSIFVSLLCLVLSMNKNQQSQGSVNNGEFLRGISCEQIR